MSRRSSPAPVFLSGRVASGGVEADTMPVCFHTRASATLVVCAGPAPPACTETTYFAETLPPGPGK